MIQPSDLFHWNFLIITFQFFFFFQWKCPPILFVIYRVIIAFFTVGSLSAFIHTNLRLPHNFMAYMTSWSYILLTLHFNLSAIIVLYHFCRSFGLRDEKYQEDSAVLKSVSSSSCSPFHSTDHEMNTCDEPCHIGDAMNNCIFLGQRDTKDCSDNSIDDTQQPSPLKLNISSTDSGGLTSSNGCTLPGDHHYMTLNGPTCSLTMSKILVKESAVDTTQDQTRWYMKISWFLYETISLSAVIVTVVYFVAIYPQLDGTNSFEDISVHGINTVLVVFEMIVAAFPVRLLHGIYTIIFGLLYIIFSLIYWSQAPYKNIIYFDMLDWNRPNNAVILVCVLLLVVIPFLQTVVFLLYKCRLRCYRRIYKENYTTWIEKLPGVWESCIFPTGVTQQRLWAGKEIKKKIFQDC